MSGDYSRKTFDPLRDFSGVLMQQGRVQLDADWNELVGIISRRNLIQCWSSSVARSLFHMMSNPIFQTRLPSRLRRRRVDHIWFTSMSGSVK